MIIMLYNIQVTYKGQQAVSQDPPPVYSDQQFSDQQFSQSIYKVIIKVFFFQCFFLHKMAVIIDVSLTSAQLNIFHMLFSTRYRASENQVLEPCVHTKPMHLTRVKTSPFSSTRRFKALHYYSTDYSFLINIFPHFTT